jgi:hypothetical protein
VTLEIEVEMDCLRVIVYRGIIDIDGVDSVVGAAYGGQMMEVSRATVDGLEMGRVLLPDPNGVDGGKRLVLEIEDENVL